LLDDHTFDVAAKEAKLIGSLSKLGNVMIAYSGGVDSSVLAYYARRHLGEQAKVVIAISPSLAQEELSAARAQAQQFHWNLIEIQTNEVTKAEYQANDGKRCYFCKSTLFEAMDVLAGKLKIENLAYGANMDDLKDYRPGHRAAAEHKVLSPLQSAELTKEEIRYLGRRAALPSWDRPQAACLSSRFPTFQPVTIEGLKQVEEAELYLHELGFKQVRVRHYPGGLAKIEVERSELKRFADHANLFVIVEARSANLKSPLTGAYNASLQGKSEPKVLHG
jgi:uncharacterized protein